MGKLLLLKNATKDRAALIDEYGNVDRLRKEFAPYEKRYQALRAEIASWYEASPPDATYIEKGLRYTIEIGARATESTINVKGAHKALGLVKFLKACSITLKALRAALAPEEADKLVSTARTGSRSISSTPIVALPNEAFGNFQSERPPFETFKKPTCKGCYALNSACGHCEKCAWEQSRLNVGKPKAA